MFFWLKRLAIFYILASYGSAKASSELDTKKTPHQDEVILDLKEEDFSSQSLSQSEKSLADFQGEALAYSQGEIREKTRLLGGISFNGAAPFKRLTLFLSKNARENNLDGYRLGGGHTIKEKNESGVSYRVKIKSYAAYYQGKWFFTESVPIYTSLEGGFLYASQRQTQPNSLIEVPSKREDLGVFLSAGAGLMWFTQSRWYFGVHLFHVSRSFLFYNFKRNGSKAASISRDFQRPLYGANLNLECGIML